MTTNDFSKVKGFKKLTESQQQFFERMHKKHMSAMGGDHQKKYAKENIKKIVWDNKEKCLEVYYPDNWWHYSVNGSWS